MKSRAQQGFTLPEILVALLAVSLMASLVGSIAHSRINAENLRAQRAEARYVAALVDRAARRGLLTGNAPSIADLQAALPQLAVPTRLGNGRRYRIALDGSDPRILVDLEVGSRNGAVVTRREVIRAPFPAAELRIPFWRARKLRQLREEAE